MHPNDMPEPTMANFASAMLEHIIAKAGNKNIRMAKIREGKVIATIGNLKFEGATTEEILDRILYWTLTSTYSYDPEEVAKAAAEALALEKEQSDRLIEELTKDGMSEFGKLVEKARQERGAVLLKAIQALEQEHNGHLPRDLEYIRKEVETRLELEEVEISEVAIALASHHRMKGLMPT